jgi:hypothetical protein
MPPKRLTLKGLSEFHYKWGKLWAFAKNRTVSRLITDVFEARIESNREEIEFMIREIAEQRGISYEEMVELVLKEKEVDD